VKRQCDESYVLETRELGEADLIVTLLACHHGKVRGVARSARRSRRRFGGALEPLTRVRASWVERDGRELHRLEVAECLRSFATMQAEPEVQAACAVIAEIARTFGHEGQGDANGFRLIGAVLEALEDGGRPRTLIRYFEYWTLRIHGLLPDLESCAFCGSVLDSACRTWVVSGRGLRCASCRPDPAAREFPWHSSDRRTLDTFARVAPARIPVEVGRHSGGALEAMLRGSLEGFAERSFRTYRHLSSASVLRVARTP
jgi:DNA repair protein RecO (recombination protein O)